MKYLILVSILSLGTVATAQAANIVGAVGTQTGNKYIEVGTSNIPVPGFHARGKAGIGVSTTALLGENAKVDLEGIALNSSHTTQYVTSGVTVYHNAKGNSDLKHQNVGTYNFVQVGDADVWFGEWSSTGAGGNWADRQAFYVGDLESTTVPTSGRASYSVKGINKFTGNNVLSGTFDVNYSTRKLSGSIQNSVLTVSLGSDVRYSRNSAKFTGSAKATGTAGSVSGVVEGHFFGANAAGLAGVTRFAHRPEYDTAFGGTKQ